MPKRGCPLGATVSPLPSEPCSPLSSGREGLGRTVSPWRRDAAACLLLPTCLAGSLLWARGWQGSHHPNPIHHSEETGTLVPVFSWLMGRKGSAASLYPASSSSLKIHQQPPALCPTSPSPSSQGNKEQPLSVCPFPSETAPAVLGLLFVGGCPCHRAAWYPNASGSCGCSAPIRMPRPPQFPL